MKLPTDKKERTQIFVLIGIVAAVLVFGIFQGVSAYNNKKKDARQRIDELRASIDKASAKIERMRGDRKENCRVLREILELTDQYVLEPHLGGNYMLEIKGIVNRRARDAGINLPEAPLDRGARKLKGTHGTFHSYQAGLSLECSYFDLLRLIYKIKESNPLVALTSIKIDPGKQDNAVHNIKLIVQWPIWANQEMEDKLREQLKSQTIEKKVDNKEQKDGTDED